MKRKIIAILLISVLLLFAGCTKEFEYGNDKFYLKFIQTGGRNSTWYSFRKKIDKDIIMEPLSDTVPNGYELIGQPHMMGFYGSMGIVDEEKDPYIDISFCCYYKDGMGDVKLNIYFNYTVASTGERKEEVWELDFGQEPFEDKRGK